MVATKEPSAKEATLLACIPSGVMMQPIHVRAGTSAFASTSKTSIASLSPWPTTYIVKCPSVPVRIFNPCATKLFGFGDPGHAP